MDTRDLYVSALKIRNLDEFQPFRAWLDGQQQEALRVLSSAKDPNIMFAAQGAYGAITRMKELIEASPGLLEKQRPQG